MIKLKKKSLNLEKKYFFKSKESPSNIVGYKPSKIFIKVKIINNPCFPLIMHLIEMI